MTTLPTEPQEHVHSKVTVLSHFRHSADAENSKERYVAQTVFDPVSASSTVPQFKMSQNLRN